MPEITPEKYHVPSVDRACRILRAVCESDEPLSMAQLSVAASASRTTSMRIISSLCSNGFLEREENGKVATGNVMHMLGSRMQTKSDLRGRAVDVLRELTATVGETAHLAIPMETHCILQEVVDSPQLIRVASRPGTVIDYHCSVTGKAILAFREDLLGPLRQSMPFTRRTAKTITDWEHFDAELETVRRKGYAIDEEEYHDDVRCVGAPVRDADGTVIAAIGITGTTNRLTKRRVTSVARLVVAAAKAISGHTP